MDAVKYLQKLIGIALTIAFSVGCAASVVTPTLPPPTAPQPTVQQGLFRFIQTVQVTPNGEFRTGNFVRIGYVPATDRLVVAFLTRLAHPIGNCTDTAHAYVEYTLDMQPTNRSGVLNCGEGDGAFFFVNNILYDANMLGPTGWGLQRFDAATFEKLSDIVYSVNAPQEGTGDMMLAFINGRLDVSGGYTETGGPPPLDEGAASHHNFFTPDLDFIEKRILSDVPHRSEGSMIFVDGICYYVTSTSYTGDLIVIQYDDAWNYLSSKVLVEQAHFPTGIAFDGQRFYVAYADTSQRNSASFFPCYPNVHLAAFDREWNLLDDVAVTDFAPPNIKANKPWVILHGNRLYVSYDVTPLEPGTGNELLDQNMAFVSVYELTAP